MSLEQKILQLIALRKASIIKVFQLFEASLVIVFLMLAGILLFVQPQSLSAQFLMAVSFITEKAGNLAVVFFCLAISPGILTRLQLKLPFVMMVRTSLMLFRRHMGILMYLFAVLHGLIGDIIPRLSSGMLLQNWLSFEYFGLTALLVTTPLFLTSNDWAQNKLGKNWKKLHKLVYVIVWIIFFHVMLVGASAKYIIGSFAVAELISLITFARRPKNTNITPPSSV